MPDPIKPPPPDCGDLSTTVVPKSFGSNNPPPPAFIGSEPVAVDSKFVDPCNTSVWVRYKDSGHVEVNGTVPVSKHWPSKVATYQEIIDTYAAKFVVPPAWIAAFVAQESGGVEDAVSSAGAAGLMQLMPSTAKWLTDPKFPGQTPGHTGPSREQLFDPRLNLELGSKLLDHLYQKHGGNIMPMAVEYSRGKVECGEELGSKDPETGERKPCPKDNIDFGYVTHCNYVDGIIAYVNRAVEEGFVGNLVIDLDNEVDTTSGSSDGGSGIFSVVVGMAFGAAAVWAAKGVLTK